MTCGTATSSETAFKKQTVASHLIGRDFSTFSLSQREINVDGAASIAEICALSARSPALVHCSPISANAASENTLLQTKGLGEQAVKL